MTDRGDDELILMLKLAEAEDPVELLRMLELASEAATRRASEFYGPAVARWASAGGHARMAFLLARDAAEAEADDPRRRGR